MSCSLDGTILNANRQAYELLGFPADCLVGRSVIDLYAPHPQGKEKAQRLQKQSQRGEEIRGEELVMQRHDGSHMWVSLTVRLVRDSEGQVLECRGIIADISARKRTEELQVLQRSALEHIVLGQSLSDILNDLCRQVEHMLPRHSRT